MFANWRGPGHALLVYARSSCAGQFARRPVRGCILIYCLAGKYWYKNGMRFFTKPEMESVPEITSGPNKRAAAGDR
jgi:hypothetical protein